MKNIINIQTGKITTEELTAEEIAEKQEMATKHQAEIKKVEDDVVANNALKASAKAKLMSGEALTEEEADTIVL